MIKAIPFNSYEDGISRTIKAQCAFTSLANMVRQDSFGAGVIVITYEHRIADGYETDMPHN